MAGLLVLQKPFSAGGTAFVPVSATAPASGGDLFPNTGHEFIYVKNGSGAPITVTFDSPNICSQGVQHANHDLVVTVANGAEKQIGPFSVARFNDGNNKVTMLTSLETTVTVALVSGA